MILRIILIVAIVVLLLWFLGQRVTTRGQAWGKIGVFVLFAFGAVALIFPGVTNDIAHAVGIGRGADLLLYCLAIVFSASLIGQYLHRQDEQIKFNQLARKVAILEANRLNRNQQIIALFHKEASKKT